MNAKPDMMDLVEALVVRCRCDAYVTVSVAEPATLCMIHPSPACAMFAAVNAAFLDAVRLRASLGERSIG